MPLVDAPIIRAGDFVRLGPAAPTSPMILAVPHAGRDYPPDLLAALRIDQRLLESLEDRYADRLVAGAVAAGCTAFIATIARAAIDLNRDPREIDRAMVTPVPDGRDLLDSAKLRAGLGLVPRRVTARDIYHARLPLAMIEDRIARHHRPWHDAIAKALAAARARFGFAVLLDCHSMPSLKPRNGSPSAQVVIGDLFGASAAPVLVERALRVAADFRCARNLPYAGGYALARHGRPAAGVHAIQLEVDRSCYLDAALRSTGPGLDRITALVTTLAAALASATDAESIAAE